MSDNMAKSSLWLLLVLSFVLPLHALAQVPQTLHYQGYLTSSTGAPVNGPTSITFKLYSAASGGSALWSETHASVSVVNGNYQVILGNTVEVGLPFNAQYWLGVTVGVDAEMVPRQALTMVPYAYRAVTANSLAEGATIDGTQVTGTISNVGIVGATIVNSTIYNPQLAGTEANCDASRAGALRWVAATASFEGCNGSVWVRLELGSLWTTRLIEPDLASGSYSALAIGADGLPFIAYRDSTTQDLRVTKCSDARCFERTVAVPDSAGNVGEHVSVAMDGANPVIAYHDASNGKLKVAKCANASCSGATITTINDATAIVGQFTSIKVPPGGTPVISYYDVTNGDLKVAKCSAQDCSGVSTINTIDATGNTGLRTSLAIGAAGWPVIAYQDFTNQRIRIAACNDAACASSVLNTVDPGGSVGSLSLAIGADGLPVIAYRSDASLKVAKCADAQCAAPATITTVDAASVNVSAVSIALGAGGLPVISYHGATDRILKVAKCVSADCTGASTLMTVDASSFVSGTATSIAIAGDGRAVVSYCEGAICGLKLAKCMSAQAPCQ